AHTRTSCITPHPPRAQACMRHLVVSIVRIRLVARGLSICAVGDVWYASYRGSATSPRSTDGHTAQLVHCHGHPIRPFSSRMNRMRFSSASNVIHGRLTHQTIVRLPPHIRYPFSVRTQGMRNARRLTLTLTSNQEE